ncbi:MAG TPA: ABC transporter ATP-binding protein [Burkholderiales bacterium]|jgi:putative spermidine/putrescine transport system ATP-binding protein|nr:ABC transporter ATP-binding protein [Burkholderiales bacterium]
MSTAISILQCAKTYPNGTRALHPVNLEVVSGETLVLLGPSGCGKTSLLRMIAGLETPDAGGRILFGTEDVTAQPPETRNVGMVFQSYALFPNMSVAQNVGYGLRIRGLPEAQRIARVAEMLEMVQLTALAGRRIDQLSGGQRQRVALARAIAVTPRVLLLDEPLTALDAKLRESLRVDIDALLRKAGITAIYVTHDQAEAMALGDRIVVMDHGEIVQIGTPTQIYHAPANAFVADFVGSVNRLQGRVEGGLWRCGDAALPWPASAPAGGVVMVRPEDLRLGSDAAGAISGRLAARYFLGNRTRLLVDIGQDAPVVVDTSERGDFALDSQIHLRIDPATMIVLPA